MFSKITRDEWPELTSSTQLSQVDLTACTCTCGVAIAGSESYLLRLLIGWLLVIDTRVEGDSLWIRSSSICLSSVGDFFSWIGIGCEIDPFQSSSGLFRSASFAEFLRIFDWSSRFKAWRWNKRFFTSSISSLPFSGIFGGVWTPSVILKSNY